VLALVVYESFWGNTGAVARAIAEGIGGARVLHTDEATAELVAGVDLLVVGAPVLGFRLPTEGFYRSLPQTELRAPRPPDVSHQPMRLWLERLPRGHGAAAAFETRVSWSPGGSIKTIEEGLSAAGFRVVAKGGKFVVAGRYGPMRDGELDKARAWGAALAATTSSTMPVA
jgi:flavorubredoxin